MIDFDTIGYGMGREGEETQCTTTFMAFVIRESMRAEGKEKGSTTHPNVSDDRKRLLSSCLLHFFFVCRPKRH